MLGRCSDSGPSASTGDALGKYLVDATAVEIDDLEAPALSVEGLADVRQIA
jgi:hypothetical protein